MTIIHMQHNDEPDDINDLEAGSEVDNDILDDAERDALAAQQANEDAGTAEHRSKEDILAEMRAAMGGDEPAEAPQPKDDKPKDEAATPADGGEDKGDPPGDKPADEGDDKAAAAAEADRVAKVDEEFNALRKGGKDATRDRFHEMAATINQQSQTLELYKEFGDALALKAEITGYREFQEAIFATNLSADDFKNVAGYKASINSNDPAAWESARQFLINELNWLETERMGIRAAEGKDLLDDYPDLYDEVQRGEISRERAEQIAKADKIQKSARAAEATAGTQTAAQQAESTAVEACANVATALSTANQAEWAAKWPKLEPLLREIQQQHPADQWATQMELAYRRLPYQPPTPRSAPIRPGVLPRSATGSRRPGGSDPGGMRVDKTNQSPLDALREGLNSA